jgi:hypothetical protein
MASSGILHRVAPVRTDISEELRTSIIRVTSAHFVFLRSVRRLLVTANVPSSLIIITLMKEALCFYETSVLTRATRRNNPEDTILHSHRRENFTSYEVYYCYVSLEDMLNKETKH